MFEGSMVALVTPMRDDGSLDMAALRKLVDWHIDQGTNAIVAVGTTGESATLSVEEHVAVIEAVVEQVDGKIPVIAGTGANSTSEAIELMHAAQKAGANGGLSVTPYYNKPTQKGLYLHHKAISEACSLPQILYNVPGRTGVDMLPETVLQLAELEHIVGIKEATGDLERAKVLVDGAPEGFSIYSGDDITAAGLMLLGGKGNISVTANVAPKLVSKMCALAIAGNGEEANAINEQLMTLHKSLFLESNPIPVKWAVAELGLMANGIRLPLTVLDEQYHEPVRSALKGLELV